MASWARPDRRAGEHPAPATPSATVTPRVGLLAPLAQVGEGLRAARRDEAVWAIILLAAVYNLGSAAATFVGLPTLAKLDLEAGDQGVGTLLTPLAYGVGGLLGDVLGPRGILAAGGATITLTGLVLLAYKAICDVE